MGFFDRIWLVERYKEKFEVVGRYYKFFIEKFFGEINDFFYLLYDIEFFLDRLIEFIKDEFENWVCFYKVLEIVFGFVLW